MSTLTLAKKVRRKNSHIIKFFHIIPINEDVRSIPTNVHVDSFWSVLDNFVVRRFRYQQETHVVTKVRLKKHVHENENEIGTLWFAKEIYEIR